MAIRTAMTVVIKGKHGELSGTKKILTAFAQALWLMRSRIPHQSHGRSATRLPARCQGHSVKMRNVHPLGIFGLLRREDSHGKAAVNAVFHFALRPPGHYSQAIDPDGRGSGRRRKALSPENGGAGIECEMCRWAP